MINFRLDLFLFFCFFHVASEGAESGCPLPYKEVTAPLMGPGRFAALDTV